MFIRHLELARHALHEEECQHRGNRQEGAQRQDSLHKHDEAGIAKRLNRRGAHARRPVIARRERVAIRGHVHASPARRQSWMWMTPLGEGSPSARTKSWVIFFSVIRARASAASWSGRAILGLAVITSDASRFSMPAAWRRISPSVTIPVSAPAVS